MAVLPQLYLFLSVDVIGSTALKYNKDSPIDDWYSVFTDFYVSFPDEFRTHLESEYVYNKQLNYSRDNLVVWKYAGDEVLFYAEITQNDEISCILSAFKKTLEDWYSSDNKLDVKGCVWIGQFPFVDRKIEEEGRKKFDFLGPSIDCGFRLGKYSSKDEIAISVEVADQIRNTTSLQSSVYYLKSENLKGVLGNKQYPIFVLKLEGAKTDEYDYLKTPCHPINLNNFITKYYEDMEKDFKGKVSRIEKDIPSYLDKQKPRVKKMQLSKTTEQENAKEIDSNKQGNSEVFEKLDDLVSQNDNKPKTEE